MKFVELNNKKMRRRAGEMAASMSTMLWYTRGFVRGTKNDMKSQMDSEWSDVSPSVESNSSIQGDVRSAAQLGCLE